MGDPDWLDRSEFIPRVTGYHEAAALLADSRFHADFAGIIEGVGGRDTMAWRSATASLLSLNGDDHKRVRAVVAPFFTPRAVERVRPLLAGVAEELVEGLPADGRCDFIRAFAAPYVSAGTCRHVGFSVERESACARAIDDLAHAAADLRGRLDEFVAAGEVLLTHARGSLDERRAEPADDAITAIADAVDAGRLSPLEAEVLVASFLSAGHEPTTKQLGLLVLLLADRPSLWDDVAGGQADVRAVVEEVLRFAPTNGGVVRRVAERAELDGVTFDRGLLLSVDTHAANRDPRRFADPDRFDAGRADGGHLAFGLGAHHCLGAALARAQLQEAVRALTAGLRCPRVERVTESDGGGLAGPTAVEIAFERR